MSEIRKTFLWIKDAINECLETIRLSRSGKAIMIGFIAFLATGLGSAVAETLGNTFGKQITHLFGGADFVCTKTGKLTAVISAIACGVTGGPLAVVAVMRSDRHNPKLATQYWVSQFMQLLHSLKAGIASIRKAGATVSVAALVGGTIAAIMTEGIPATFGGGIAGALASSVGAVVVIGLSSAMDYLFRAARARAREAQANRRFKQQADRAN